MHEVISQKTAADDSSGTETRPSSQTVTGRSVCLGFLMAGLTIGMTQVLSIRYQATDVAGDAPPSAPTYLLFLYVLFSVPLARWIGRRWLLSRGELLLIYAMMLVVGPITHQFAIGFLVPHVVSPHYYNAQEPAWAVFQPTLPDWLGPRDPDAIADFFRGTGGPVPWHDWLIPIVSWSSLLIALFWVMLCLNALMRKQWIEDERLVFPLTAIPLALAEESRASAVHQPARILREGLFWLGLGIPLALGAPTAIHRYIPSVPALPLRDVILVNGPDQLSPPWTGLGVLEFHLMFWLVGVVYLLPKEVALSAWVFYFISVFENVAAVQYGTSGEAPSVYINDFPALYAQGAGAAFALAGITLWTARRHLRAVWRKAFGNDRTAEASGEFLSYRTALLGALLGIAFILGWCMLAGMRWWVASLLFGLMLAYFFVFARIRAETGMGMGIILWPKMLDEVVITLVGAKNLRLADLTMLYALRWLYFGPAIGAVMASQLEGFKLANTGGLRGRWVGGVLALAATLAVPLAFAWTLHTYYSAGFDAMPIGRRATSMVSSQMYYSYQNLVDAYNNATGPEWPGILAMGAGALIAVALSGLRTQFMWFPLHPIGFVAANSWGMQINWFSFLFGWLLKSLVMRWGGYATYTRLLPLFLGLIVGDMVHQGLWGFVAWATGGTRQ